MWLDVTVNKEWLKEFSHIERSGLDITYSLNILYIIINLYLYVPIKLPYCLPWNICPDYTKDHQEIHRHKNKCFVLILQWRKFILAHARILQPSWKLTKTSILDQPTPHTSLSLLKNKGVWLISLTQCYSHTSCLWFTTRINTCSILKLARKTHFSYSFLLINKKVLTILDYLWVFFTWIIICFLIYFL